MRIAKSMDTTRAFESAAPEHFHITVIYDTPKNGFAAMNLCNSLVANFSAEFLFHIALCELSSFDGHHDDTPAMKLAREARLVLIASTNPLPAQVCDWLEIWATGSQPQSSAVALMTKTEQQRSPAGSCLQNLCLRHGVDLIASDDLPPTCNRVSAVN